MSPRISARILGHKPVALNLGGDSRHRRAVSESDMTANMPISTFVRRKTPQSSPVSPTFAHRTRNRTRKRSQSPTMPVSIPTLPPVFLTLLPISPVEKISFPSQQDDDTPCTSDYSDEGHCLPSSFAMEEDHITRCVPPIV